MSNKNKSISFRIEQAELLQTLKPEDKESALNLLELFPNIPFDTIVQTLQETKGNFDQAFDILANGKPKEPQKLNPEKAVVIEIGRDGKIKGKKNLEKKEEIKWDNEIKQISTLFPDISINRIESILELLEGNVEAAIVQILNSPESQIPVPTPVVKEEIPTTKQEIQTPTSCKIEDEEKTDFFVQNPLYTIIAGGNNNTSLGDQEIDEDEQVYEEFSMQLNKIFAGIPKPVLRNIPPLKEMIMCYVTNNLDRFPELFDEEFDIIPNPELKTELFEYIEYNFEEEDEDPKEKEKKAVQEIVSFFGESISNDPFFKKLKIEDVEFTRALQSQQQLEKDQELAYILQMQLMNPNSNEDVSVLYNRWMEEHKMKNDQKSQDILFNTKFSGRGNTFDDNYLPKYASHLISQSAFKSRFGNYKIKAIKPISNSTLEAAFERKRAYFMAKYGKAPVTLGFHGTASSNVNSIIQRGLLVPGQKNNVRHTSDVGWWGRGIYLSPNVQTAIAYCRGSGCLLVCAVLMGKCLKVTQRMDGKNITPGYDSHITSNMQEMIIPTASQVLPIYVVEFENSYYSPSVGSTLTKTPTAVYTSIEMKGEKLQKKLARLAARFGKGNKMKLSKKQRRERRRN